MTDSRRALLRSFAPSVEHFPSVGQKPVLLVAEQGVGKTYFMEGLLLSVSAFHREKVIPIYLSLTTKSLPSRAIYTALVLAGYGDNSEVRKVHLSALLNFCKSKGIALFLVIDELQEGAAWEDVGMVNTLHEELTVLREEQAGVWILLTGSSQYTPQLAFGEYAPVSQPEKRFIHYKTFARCLKRDRVTTKFDKPITSKVEFIRMVDCVLAPEGVDYDSDFWSLEVIGKGGSEMEIDKDEDEDEGGLWEERMARLYLVTGGNMRKLFGGERVQWLKPGAGRDGLTEPSEEVILALIREEALRYEKRVAAAQGGVRSDMAYVAVIQMLYEHNLALMKGPELEDDPTRFQLFDLQSVSPAEVSKLHQVPLTDIFDLADDGSLSLRLAEGGKEWSYASFPRPSIFIALLYLNKLRNADVTTEEIWMARIIFSSAGIGLEHVLNKAILRNGGLIGPQGTIPVSAYAGEFLSVIPSLQNGTLSEKAWKHTTLATPVVLVLIDDLTRATNALNEQNQGKRVNFGKAERLRLAENLDGHLLRTYPHNKPGGGADAVLFWKDEVHLLQYKLGASLLTSEMVDEIWAKLEKAGHALRQLFSLDGRTTFSQHNVKVWDRDILKDVWPDAIKEVSNQVEKAKGIFAG
ncbi:hypothetical protein HDV00_004755 [Rhizophlyctis rosea]|nr:hypothetical protein HDV00_004755 [Rhizophlyctis rosea]